MSKAQSFPPLRLVSLTPRLRVPPTLVGWPQIGPLGPIVGAAGTYVSQQLGPVQGTPFRVTTTGVGVMLVSEELLMTEGALMQLAPPPWIPQHSSSSARFAMI